MHRLTHKPGLEGWIGLLFVSPELRKLGIATQLIDQMQLHFIAHNCTSVRLLLDGGNQIGENLYIKLGFTTYEKKLVRDLE